jgi:hypothetical protein
MYICMCVYMYIYIHDMYMYMYMYMCHGAYICIYIYLYVLKRILCRFNSDLLIDIFLSRYGNSIRGATCSENILFNKHLEFWSLQVLVTYA